MSTEDFRSYLHALERRLAQPLPGLDAQRRMAPEGRIPADYSPTPPEARYGAVLLLLYPSPDGVVVPFIRRPADDTPHGGQIAFPGGGFDHGDQFPDGTAIREAWEEVGLDGSRLRVLGVLTPLYIWVSNYSVFPVVASMEEPPRFSLNPTEVESLEIIALEDLHPARSRDTFDARGHRIVAPCFTVDAVRIWGATAMMLNEFMVLHEGLYRSEGPPQHSRQHGRGPDGR